MKKASQKTIISAAVRKDGKGVSMSKSIAGSFGRLVAAIVLAFALSVPIVPSTTQAAYADAIASASVAATVTASANVKAGVPYVIVNRNYAMSSAASGSYRARVAVTVADGTISASDLTPLMWVQLDDGQWVTYESYEAGEASNYVYLKIYSSSVQASTSAPSTVPAISDCTGTYTGIYFKGGSYYLYHDSSSSYFKSYSSQYAYYESMTLYEVSLCDHEWVKGATTDPTCTADGYTAYTCSKCNKTKKDDVVSALGHDTTGATAKSNNDGTHGFTCARCKTSVNEDCTMVDNGVKTEATCTEKGAMNTKCSVCGYASTRETDALGHDYKDGVCTRCGAAEPQDVEIGTGTLTTAVPYIPSYKYATSQMIYTADEIAKTGSISAISFYVSTAASLATTELKVYMGHKSSTTFSSSTDYVAADDLTLVYSGNPTLGTSTGWEKISLDTPFAYNGKDNLVIAVCRKSSSYSTSLKYLYTMASSTVLSRQNDYTEGYGAIDGTGSYSTTYQNYRPNITLTFTPAAAKTKVAVPKAETGLVYNGQQQTGVAAGDNYTVTGNTATDAGDYTATLTLADGCEWEDATFDGTVKWSIAKKAVDAPKAAAGLTYNGSEQTGVEAGEGYTASGNTATDAGDYTATLALGKNYAWSDAAFDGKVTWSIAKKDMSSAAVSVAKGSYVYNGKAQTPEVTVTLDGEALAATDFAVSYSQNTNAGTAKVAVNGTGNYTGTCAGSFAIAKAAQTLTLTKTNQKLKKTTIRKKAVTRKGAIKVKGAMGKVTYTKVSGSKLLSINKKTGAIKLAKHRCPKWVKYNSIKVKVTSAATANYKAASKTITLRFNMK